MANKRNLEIFGHQGISKRTLIIGAILLLGVLASAWPILTGRDGSATITTQAVLPTPTEESTATADTSEETAQDTIPAQEDEERAFYEYGGQCASDVKRAEDDVTDVTNYLTGYQTEHDTLHSHYQTLKQEYEAKLEELELTYQPDLQRFQEKIAQSQQDLQRTQEQLATIKTSCNF